MRPALTKLIIPLFFVITGFNSVWSQSPSECNINQSNCPPPDLMQTCADTVVGGISGAYVHWTGPDFSLSCDSSGGPGYAFEMSFDIPESQSQLGCWLFSKVQRTGTGGGRLRLWQSTQSNTNPNPNFTTPSFFLPASPTNASMTITNGSGSNITCNVYLVYPDGTLSPLNATFNISGSNIYTFTVTPAHFGIYRLFFEFTGSGDNMDYVELLRINASLYGTTCTGDINFYNFSTSIPGDFFPVGTTPVSYIAILRDAVGNIILSDSCNFNVIVNEVKATAIKTDAHCTLNNGSISLTAQSTSASPLIQYSLNGGGWINFTPGSLQGTISNLSTGSYLIEIRDISLIGNCKTIHPLNISINRIIDDIPPAITCPADISIAGCNTGVINGLVYSEEKVILSASQFASAGGIAMDSCGITEYSYKDSKSGTCPIIVSRVFTVKDLAGNSSSCTQSITIFDNIAPVVPANETSTVECLSAATVPTTPVVIDNCGSTITPVLFSTVDTPSSITCEGTRVYTYKYSDCAENSSIWTYTYKIKKTPFANPIDAGTTVACAALAVPPALPIVKDNCNNVLIPFDTIVSSAPECEGIITYTYLYKDCAGNEQNWVYTYTIERLDFKIPNNEGSSVACVSQMTQPVPPSVSDHCGNTITPSGPVVSGNPACSGAKVYTWTYSDCERNTHDWSYTYTLNDNIAPNLIGIIPVGQSNMNLCFANIPAGPSASEIKSLYADNCDGEITVTKSGTPIGNSCSWSVTYVYEVKDACGNIVTPSPTVTYSGGDKTNPIIVCPTTPVSVVPNSGPNYTHTGTSWDATATDNCSVPSVTFTLSGKTTSPNNLSTLDGVTFNYGATLVTWTATDACGNRSSCSYTINVTDNTPPEISCPPAISRTCINLVPSPYTSLNEFISAGGSASDISGIDPSSFTLVSQTSDGLSCPETITRVYEIADIIGNKASCSQIITILDNIAPTFTRPADITIYTNANCEYDASVAVTGDVTDEADNCSTELEATYADVVTNGECEGTHVITRTWSLVDNCGNAAANQIQTITVSDNMAPTFTSPADVTIFANANCEYDASVARTGDVTDEADNCSTELEATYADVVTNGECEGTHVIIRTWSLVDNCGNTAANQTQIITVLDNSSPIFTSPDNITVNNDPKSCGAIVTIPIPVTEDNCSSVTLVNDVNGTSDASGFYPVGTTTISWIGTDACGNSTIGSMNVTVIDNEAPVITCPEDVVSCSPIFTLGTPTVMDNCNVKFIVNDAPGIFPIGTPTIVTWTATDIHGNSSSCSQSVTISNMNAFAEGSSQVSCHNGSDGVITVDAIGGTGSYTYRLNNEEPEDNNVFSGLEQGTYSVVVTDESGCTIKTNSVIIHNPYLLTASAEGSSQVSCNNESDGIISVTASGGTGALTYSLDNLQFQDSSVFRGLEGGVYTVLVTDANGCTTITEAITIENPIKLTLTAKGSDFVTCNNGNDGVIYLRAYGGTGNYLYALNDGRYQPSGTFTNLKAGTYTGKVKDANQCSAEATKSISNPSEIIAIAYGQSSVSCPGSTDGSFTVYAEGGIGNYQYSVNGGNYETNNFFDNLAPGEYNISVIDEQSCMGNTSFTIYPKEPIVVEVPSIIPAECDGSKGGSATVKASGGTPPYNYQWSNGNIGTNATDLPRGAYIITITDANRCQMLQNVIIELNNNITEIEPTNVFSPNEDGFNDTWTIKNIGKYTENELVIINRWGNEVYTQKSYNNEWNGSQLNEGTYFYILKIKMCNEDRKYSGFITIIK